MGDHAFIDKAGNGERGEDLHLAKYPGLATSNDGREQNSNLQHAARHLAYVICTWTARPAGAPEYIFNMKLSMFEMFSTLIGLNTMT